MLEIACAEREVDYRKTEDIVFVVVLFLFFLHCQFNGEDQCKKQIFEYQ